MIRLLSSAMALALLATPAAAQLPRRAQLGIVMPPARQQGQGAVVAEVAPGGTAAALGLRADDVIVRVNDTPVARPQDLGPTLSRFFGGTPIRLTVRRGGGEQVLRGAGVERPRDAYPGARVDYGAVPFRGGRLRDILVTPEGVANPPIVYLLQGFSCVTIENELYHRLIEELLKDGIGFYRVEKAGIGDSAGGVNCVDIDFATELDGFRSAYNHLIQARGVDPDRIFMLGHSMGGFQAPFLAAERAPRGIAIFGAGLRNWADYNLDLVRFQSFLLFGQDPAAAAVQAENYRELFRRFYFGREAPAAIAAGSAANAQALREAMSWDGGERVLGRHYKFTQDLAHQPLTAAWRDARTNVLAMYGEADIVALFDEDHRVIAEIANHYRPGSGRYVEIARTGHGMDVSGDRQELRRRVVATGNLAFGAFNPEVARVLAGWIREAMARPAWRTVTPAAPAAGG
ncbi:MAG TPA: alpha/beta fold hydrolase [Allosphingosinicella sp.]|nr:alpha/beta fold hydrolase [Allosphingosinicella sp.]